jgi:UDP-glucose 6-dehydrogenase
MEVSMHMKDSRDIEGELDNALATNAELLDRVEALEDTLRRERIIMGSMLQNRSMRDQFAMAALAAICAEVKVPNSDSKETCVCRCFPIR